MGDSKIAISVSSSMADPLKSAFTNTQQAEIGLAEIFRERERERLLERGTKLRQFKRS